MASNTILYQHLTIRGEYNDGNYCQVNTDSLQIETSRYSYLWTNIVSGN